MVNAILNLIKYVRKHGWKKGMEDWKYQFLMLDTPKQLLKKEIVTYYGALGGMTLAIIVLVTRGSWYIGIPMFFALFIMWYQLKAKLQALERMKIFEEQIKELEDNETIEEKPEEENKDGI